MLHDPIACGNSMQRPFRDIVSTALQDGGSPPVGIATPCALEVVPSTGDVLISSAPKIPPFALDVTPCVADPMPCSVPVTSIPLQKFEVDPHQPCSWSIVLYCDEGENCVFQGPYDGT